MIELTQKEIEELELLLTMWAEYSNLPDSHACEELKLWSKVESFCYKLRDRK